MKVKSKIFFTIISVYLLFALQGCTNSIRFAVNKVDYEYSAKGKSNPTTTKPTDTEKQISSTVLETQEGWASYYGGEFHGRKTANGEVFDKNKFTAAHRTLPLGTTARVTHLNNKKSVVIRINDRGPFISGRILDVAHAVAIALGFEKEGTALVQIEVLQYGDNKYYK
jgi:rare lipoprotein A